jgi:hypothetical protein
MLAIAIDTHAAMSVDNQGEERSFDQSMDAMQSPYESKSRKMRLYRLIQSMNLEMNRAFWRQRRAIEWASISIIGRLCSRGVRYGRDISCIAASDINNHHGIAPQCCVEFELSNRTKAIVLVVSDLQHRLWFPFLRERRGMAAERSMYFTKLYIIPALI